MPIRFIPISLLVCLVISAGGCGDPAPPAPDLVVRDAWVRSAVVPEGMTVPVNSAAYLTIENRGDAADHLLEVSFEDARRVELHESFVDERGIASMRPVDSVEVPPGGEARLEPGGLHVMLMGLESSLSVGDSLEIVLRFEVSGKTNVTAVVRQL
jgi:hypothetical protein